ARLDPAEGAAYAASAGQSAGPRLEAAMKLAARRLSPLRLAHPRPAEQHLHCRHRSECLDAAARWRAFSCAGCPDIDLMSEDQWRAEVGPLVLLAAAVLGSQNVRAVLADHVPVKQRRAQSRRRKEAA